MSVPNACVFFQDLEGLSEVFGRMSAGISGPKLPLSVPDNLAIRQNSGRLFRGQINMHKQLSGIILGMGGGQNCLCVDFS